MLRRGVLIGLFALVVWGQAPRDAFAHTVLVASDPPAGSALGEPPARIRLSFSEAPEPALVEIHVTDAGGVDQTVGKPTKSSESPLDVEVALKSLEDEVYDVRWRAVSKVDGHPTAGAFRFGVRVVPTDPGTSAAGEPGVSIFEIVARWLLLAGLSGALGAAVAGAAGYGDPDGGGLARIALSICALGLILLALAQRAAAGASFADLMGTTVGHALLGRGAGIAAAGLLFAVARRRLDRKRRIALWLAAAALAATVGLHVSAGHAASGRVGQWAPAAQWAHIVAAGVWAGGLLALLLAIRGAPSVDRTVKIGRFSATALVALAVVVITGTLRSLEELDRWGELTTTTYGRALSLKIVAVLGVLSLGAINRWRNLPRATKELKPLRKAARYEVGLALVALAAAAVLGSSSPPAAGEARPGIELVGSDFATTVNVRLSTLLDRPGANRFSVGVSDFDSGKPADGAVTLTFRSLEDPGEPSTTLPLTRIEPGSYGAVGNNLAFDGRWQVSVLLQRKSDSVEVPFRLRVENERQPLSVVAEYNKPVTYDVEVRSGLEASFWLESGQPGRNKLHIGYFEIIMGEYPVTEPVLTVGLTGRSPRQVAVTRLGPGTFVSDVSLPAGETTVSAVVRTAEGQRLRAVVELPVSKS